MNLTRMLLTAAMEVAVNTTIESPAPSILIDEKNHRGIEKERAADN